MSFLNPFLSFVSDYDYWLRHQVCSCAYEAESGLVGPTSGKPEYIHVEDPAATTTTMALSAAFSLELQDKN